MSEVPPGNLAAECAVVCMLCVCVCSVGRERGGVCAGGRGGGKRWRGMEKGAKVAGFSV